MVGEYITGTAILLYLMVGIVLYRTLLQRIGRHELTAVGASLIFCTVLAVVPYLLTWVGFRLGSNAYNAYPALREQSWDVRLALILYLGMLFAYFIGFVAACLGCWRFFANKRRA